MSPIYRGSTQITGCYRGTLAVSAIYRGATLVWSADGGTAEIMVYPYVHSSAATSHSSSAGTATGEAVTVPTGVQSGDLLVLYTVLDYGGAADITPPTGFTQLGELTVGATTGATHSVAYKVAGATEPASYTYQNYSTSSDGASLMLAIRDWDGDTANLRYADQITDKTARAIPSLTPAKAGLVLYSGHHDNDGVAADGVWYWGPPEKAYMAGQSHNAAQWSSQGVSAQIVTDASAISGRVWSNAQMTPAKTGMITSALSVGAGTATRTALKGDYSGGSGGSTTNLVGATFADSNLRSSTYNLYVEGLDWTKDVGILIYTDGSGEYGLKNPTQPYLLAGVDGMIEVAKRHNMILLTPMAPGDGCTDGDGTCWYMSSLDGTTDAQKLEWSRQLIADVYAKYNIDKTRVVIGGYSSGAQWTTQYFGPAYAHEYMTDGVAVAISYGGGPKVTVNNTAAFKTNVPFVWDVGSLDPSWSNPTGSGSVQEGLDYYNANGYATQLLVVADAVHDRYNTTTMVGEFGRIVERNIIQHVRPADASSAPAPTPVAEVPEVRSASTASVIYSDTNKVIAKPTGTVEGDGLFLVMHCDYGDIANFAPPTGFTVVGTLDQGLNLAKQIMAYKVAGASEPTEYTMTVPTDADLRADMLAIQNIDGAITPVYSSVRTAASATTHAAPSVTPTHSSGITLSTVSLDATAAGQTFSWTPPTGMTEHTDASTNGYVTMTTASEVWPTSDPTGARTFSLTTSSGAVEGMAGSIWFPAVGATQVATNEPVASANFTGGSGGSTTNLVNETYTSGGISSIYHLYVEGLDWTKSVGILIYTDGSNEFGLKNPTDPYLMAGPDGMIEMAKKHNMILLTPRAPGNGCNDGDGECWYDTSIDGTTPAQKTQWSHDLITDIYSLYDIDKTRVAIGGFSSGAQWTSRQYIPLHGAEVMLDGVFVPISFGGDPVFTTNFTQAFKDNVVGSWDCGTADEYGAYGTEAWNARGGYNWYTNNGFTTDYMWVEGENHDRAGLYGIIMDREITQWVPATYTR